ncbi:Cyst_wall protein C [Hexamita inflata]|uniref:Cyst wall protein C n=1 Tax=Hexamita inflata TaxID=28002 RepID=A0AA86UG78_9EUKA|nr:Cyst wall protein C [Hexamita inflata]
MHFLFSIQLCSSYADSLFDIYVQTDGLSWDKGFNWFMSEDVCDFEGVSCQNGIVIGLDFTDFGLSGMLPDSIACFPGLKSFIASNNSLLLFPEQLCSFSDSLQYIQLSHANLNGIVPECTCQLQFLQYFSIDNNQLIGQIPLCISSIQNLKEFIGTCNKFSGKMMGIVGPELENYFINCQKDIQCEQREGVVVMCGLGGNQLDYYTQECRMCSYNCPHTQEITMCGKYFFIPK